MLTQDARRIEACIQRYRAKRRFDSHRRDLFDKYLSLGGIDTGPKMFSGGLDPKTIDGMNAQEIATMTATDYVGRDKSGAGMLGQKSEWVVDFEGVAKGYLYVLTIRPPLVSCPHLFIARIKFQLPAI